MRIPDAEHPITIEPNPSRIVVTVAGHVVADTVRALFLQEASYPAVHYIPVEDVDMTSLERSDLKTYCPYKGECCYFNIPLEGEKGINAVWTYDNPYPAVEPIKGHVAFYPDRVDSTEIAAKS